MRCRVDMTKPANNVRSRSRSAVSLTAFGFRHGQDARATKKRGRRAFTLIEVLVALCIFAMAAVVLASAYLNVLNGYEVVARGTQVNEDFAFARQQVIVEPDRKKLEQGGEFETTGGRRARWSVEIESSTVADVYKVTFLCEISDPARAEPDKQTQTFMLLRPTWVIDPGERSKLKEEAKTRILELQGKLKK
jgi:prepilin-type N-terminal cleavage/methylation domain-containing protein